VSSEPDAARAQSGPPSGQTGLGRTILLAVGATVVAISGVLGFFIGTNGAEVAPQSAVLGGALTLPTTPLAMTLYAMAVSTVVLVSLFGLVSLASRFDDADVSDRDS
jgi:hypothetical protein